MSVGKTLTAFLSTCILVVLLAGCTGKEGPAGPPGYPGEPGPPGQNLVATPITSQDFGVLIANSTAADYVGAYNVSLTSDTLASGANKVIAFPISTPPAIDGVDGGGVEWKSAVTYNVALDSIAGAYSGITNVEIRAAFDRTYVYMQFKWQEVANGEFIPAADVTKRQWVFDSTGASWSQSGGEDRLLVSWALTNITGWASEGAKAIFDGANFRTPAAGEFADLWEWQSTETNYSGWLADKIVGFAASGDNSAYDVGVSPAFVIENPANNGNPTYMKAGSTVYGSTYPLRSFDYTLFANPTNGWRNGATVPGYIFFAPSGSAADVRARGTFDTGTGVWTVELSRMRKTGNGDDAAF